MPTNKALITLEKLSYSVVREHQGTVSVLKDINLQIFENEILGVTGSSGIGKSSLCSLLGGLEQSGSGKIISREGLKINLVFQECSLLPWKTIFQNLELALPQESEAKSEAINTILSKFGLQEVKNEYPSGLSGGMKQRANIARAMLSEPDVLIMDESLNAIDESNIALVERLLLDYRAAGHAIVFVSHNLHQLFDVSDRVIVLNPNRAGGYQEFKLGLPFPRDAADRDFELYAKLEKGIMKALRARFKHSPPVPVV